MSLLKRKVSPAQSAASRENSLRSTGPRTERGKEVSSRNSLNPRLFSRVAGPGMEALGERPEEFEEVHKRLAIAMAPRDAWEEAWVQDIAILRWRLERLQRHETAMLAERRRKRAAERKQETLPASGSVDRELRSMVYMVGLTGVPDSPWKFQQIQETLVQLRDVIHAQMFNEDALACFHMLYGKEPGARGLMFKNLFQMVCKRFRDGNINEDDADQFELIKIVNQEIDDYQKAQALYEADHKESDPVREDAELLLPRENLDSVIRYETHLEDQIERKLRQFYARRREGVLPREQSLPSHAAEAAPVDQPRDAGA